MTDYDILSNDKNLTLPSFGEEKTALSASHRAILKDKMGPDSMEHIKGLHHFGLGDVTEQGLEGFAGVHEGTMDKGELRNLRAIHGERTLGDRVLHGWNNEKARDKAMAPNQPSIPNPAKIAIFGRQGYSPTDRAILQSKGMGGVAKHLNKSTGASVGGAAGALMGAIAPGEEEIRDEEGRVVGSRKKSRLGGAAKGALGGAALGAMGGGLGQGVTKKLTKNVAADMPRSELKQLRQQTGNPSFGDKATDVAGAAARGAGRAAGAAAGGIGSMAQKVKGSVQRAAGGGGGDFPSIPSKYPGMPKQPKPGQGHVSSDPIAAAQKHNRSVGGV